MVPITAECQECIAKSEGAAGSMRRLYASDYDRREH